MVVCVCSEEGCSTYVAAEMSASLVVLIYSSVEFTDTY